MAGDPPTEGFRTGKTIGGVLTLHDAQGEAVPAVFDSPHSGLGIPDDIGCRPGERELLGSADEIDTEMLDAPGPGPVDVTKRVRLGSELILRVGPDGLALYDRQLAVAEVEHRIEAYWKPYNQTLAELMDAAHDRFGCVFHVNCHSNRTLGTVHAPG